MDDDTAAPGAPPIPAPPPGRPPANRRLGVVLAMVGLLAVAGVGLATRLDRSDNRIEVGTAPVSDTAPPDDTVDTNPAGVGTGRADSSQATPIPTIGDQSITTGTPLPTGSGEPRPSVQGTTVNPTATGPMGTARVTLGCGDTADTRKVTAFEADTTAGPTALYWSEPAGRLHQLRVGDQFPAGARLAWSVVGVQLGPWDPDTVADACTAPIPAPTTPTRYTVPPTSVTAPVPGYDPAWTAQAVLACGDTAGTRRVTSFDATTNGAGTANLMAWDPATGRITQLAVGDQFPVTHTLSWAIQGVFLGPWPVPQVTDNC